MKKLFLIPLMTLCTCVMAWAADAHVSNITDLKAAVANASVETIYLDADIQYAESGNSSCINILRSVTIDGQGHTLSGYGKRGTSGNYPTIAINQGGSSLIDVTLKNLNIVSTYSASYSARPLETRGNIRSLTLINDSIYGVNSGNKQIITIGGSQNSNAEVTIKDCVIGIGNRGYGMILFNPITLDMQDSEINAWCSFYFKGQWDPINNYSNSCHGAVNTEIVAENCIFNNPGICGSSNSFGAFVLEDDGIDITLKNCVVKTPSNCTNATQVVYELSKWKKYIDKNLESKTSGVPCTLTIEGSNSHIQGDFIDYSWDEEGLDTIPVNFYLQGGSYYGDDFEAAMTNTHVSIPTGYHAEKVSQGGDSIYRVVKDAAVNPETSTLYNLNDFVEGEGVTYGNNPVSSFNLSTGENMTLNNETTTAGYVEIKDNGTTGTTVTVGQTAGGENQTLVINNGLDVQGNSQVIVESGATLQIGEGGIVTSDPANIVIEANENGAASMIMDPAITVNTMPNLTVKMTAKQIGRNDVGDYYWHRFAMPVAHIDSWDKEGDLGEGNDKYPTYIYAWNYATNNWESIAPSDMVPLQGYTLTLASEYIDGDAADGKLNELKDVVYTFKGNLVGNTDQPLDFQEEGFNYFGNSYTGYMHVKTVLEGLEDGNIDGTAYMWCNDPANDAYQTYVGVSLYKLQKGRGLEEWMKEVAPMQTFILRLRGAESADESINYASAIWGNPRYGNNSAGVAPRRAVASVNEDTYMEISVKAANGKSSTVDFTESAANSDAFESGYDVEKYMNEKTINLYATINGVNHSSVVTNNIEGKTLSLKTNAEIAYTMSFKNVEGNEYAIRDNVTGQVIAIEEGAAYEFAAQPNSTVEGRFEILPIAKMPTAIENTEVKANVKGIYTIMGQYLGEDFDVLPAGVYVVNGVKIVK